MVDEKDYYFNEIFEEYKRLGEIQGFGKKLGNGSFGIVKEVIYKNKQFAGKLTIKDSIAERELSEDLKGSNIIKFYKVCNPISKYGNTYHLIIMEKAILKDLGKLNQYFHEHNLLKLIFRNCFNNEVSDSLLRYYSRQILEGLETLDKKNLVHFDIKPENILVTINMILKLSDFSISKKVDESVNEFLIPGGTQGYLTPEYYLKKTIAGNNAKKEDYFAFGATLFYLKYGFPLMHYNKNEDREIVADKIVQTIIRKTNYIASRKFVDRDFVIFITHLLNIKFEYRYNFEQIYRNKWLNKNLDDIEKIVDNYDTDEEKFLMELQKLDFILQKNKIFGKDNIKDNNKKNDNLSNKEISKKESIKKNNRKNFRFKKKKIEDEFN